MSIRGGYTTYQKEIEKVFYKHPDVTGVAIVEFPDATLGEIACACVKLEQNAKAGIDDLLSFVKGKVADYKVPDKLLIVEELPMTLSGKVKKVALQEQLKEKLNAELG